MRDGDFGMMPVVENDRMIAAISDRDIAIRGVAEGMDPDTKANDVRGHCWGYEDDSVEQAAVLMSDLQVRRLPVVNRDSDWLGSRHRRFCGRRLDIDRCPALGISSLLKG